MADSQCADSIRLDGLPSYELSPDQRAIFEQADRYGREVLAPRAEQMDNEEYWPDGIFPELGRQGFLGLTVPEEYGGVGLDLWTSGLVVQALARWNQAVALSYLAHENLTLNNIWRNGSEEQHRKYLPGLCQGTLVGAMGMTEPGAGSDALGSMRTTATRDGDRYILKGRKMFITNGPIADVVLVYAKTDMALGNAGISAFIVEKDFPGFSVAQKLTKMGFRGSPTGELVFDECEVPLENLVGNENEGAGVMMSGLDLERATAAALSVGIAERTLQISVEYAKIREQFGRPIGSFQMVQAKLADMYVWVETMNTFCQRTLAAANRVESGEGGRGEIHKLTAGSIMYCAEACGKVLSDGVQIHGGGGYIWESEMNRLFRCIKIMEIGAGTTEIRKSIIAKELLSE